MSINEELAARFASVAAMLEILGEDQFRVNAMARAARSIENHPADLAGLDRKGLLAIEGVGARVADKILEFATTGGVAEFEEIRSRVPRGLLEIMELPGVGPKTVGMFWREANVTDIAGLERIIADGSILKLPRMGGKTVEKIRQSLAFGRTASERLAVGIVLPLAERIVGRLRAMPGVVRCEYAGSLRRGRETVGDIDVLVEAGVEGTQISRAFRELPEVKQILAAGDSKSSARMAITMGSSRWGSGGSGGGTDDATPTVQVDLRVVPPGRFGAAWMYFTGSKEHNVQLRERAQKMGLTLNEYGLFRAVPEGEKREWATEAPIAAATEEEVFKSLGVPWVPPEIREAAGELQLEATPRLIELADIKAELHAHTTASDGRLSIEELATKAKERGFHTIAVTDHSRSSAQANGLSVERLLQHVEDVHKTRETVKGIRILAGSEVDIHADGTLDYEDDVLRKLDVVVASPHTALSQDEETCTARLVRAIRHPLVHILGHPTGRLVNRRKGLNPRMAELVAAARECNVALEVNSHWLRLDLRDIHVREAVTAGCLIAIDCDVHDGEDFENLRFGVTTARRGWLTPEQCVNAWGAERLGKWLDSKR
ncbi:MAG: DNA polymerase/3'-5' exonuclease PolX [Planctomycetota bacterium]